MKRDINILADKLDELESFVTDFYAPVKMDRLERRPQSSKYGAIGHTSRVENVSFEWSRTIGDFRIEPLTDFDAVIFKFCKTGGVLSRTSSGSHYNKPGTAMAFSRPKSLDILGGTEHATVAIDKQFLLKRLSALLDRPVVPDLCFIEEPTAGGVRFGALSRFVDDWYDSPLLRFGGALPQLSKDIANIIADSFLLSYPNNYSEILSTAPLSIAPKHVKRVLDYIRSNPNRHISTEALAELSGVSVRALQYAFRASTGQTVTEYQLQLRLAHARQQILESPRTSLSTVAQAWGFGSLTRFGQSFKAAYGELPSVFQRSIK